MKHTVLYTQHLAAEGKMVPFCGWEMPIHYGSQLNEHRHVRDDAGLFDVSHMRVIDIFGPQVVDFLRYLLANSVDKLTENGRALYSCMLNEQGGVVDDLIVYRMTADQYRFVVNAGTAEQDWAWIEQHAADFTVKMERRDDLAILAVQGPQAYSKAKFALPLPLAEVVETLQPFQFVTAGDWMMARTGYTGEEGIELILPEGDIQTVWETLLAEHVSPCGLGARDTLRLEAGLNLHGADMDEATTPLESNLGWTVDLRDPERRFIGRSALESQLEGGLARQLVGLVLEEGKGIIRAGSKVIVDGQDAGVVTSGSFSPTLGCSIGLARVPAGIGDHALLELRGKTLPVRVVNPPFVRNGSKTFD